MARTWLRTAAARVAVRLGDDLTDGQLAELPQRLDDGRERRRELGAFVESVEPDHGEILRHADPPLARDAQDAERHLVVRDEDARPSPDRARAAIRRRGPRSRPTSSPATTGPGDTPAARSASRQPGLPVLGLVPRLRPGQVPDPPASERQQVLGRETGAAAVVDDDGRVVRRRLRLDEDHRRATAVGSCSRTVAMLVPIWGAAKMMPSTWCADHEVEDRDDVDRLGAVDLLEQDAVAGGLGLLGDAVEGLRHAEVAQAGHDHAERLRPTVDEAPRDGVRLEPRGRDGRLDRLAGLRRHVGSLVDDTRHGLRRDARHPGDLLDRRPAVLVQVSDPANGSGGACLDTGQLVRYRAP